MDCWQILGIAPTGDEAAIKRAYAQKLKQHRSDRDTEGFIRLRAAYESALADSKQAPACNDYDYDYEEAPLLDARVLRRSWRQAKSDAALLALLQQQSATLPTIDEQLDFRDLIASWIEARDRPQRYPQSLIWIVEKYQLLHGLDDDDPLRHDYLRALICSGDSNKARTVLALRYPELAAWLAQQGWRKNLARLKNICSTRIEALIDWQLARLQQQLALDNAAIRATFPATRRLQPRFGTEQLASLAAVLLAAYLHYPQTALCLLLLAAYRQWWQGELYLYREQTLPAASTSLYLGSLALYGVLAVFAPATWNAAVAVFGFFTALLGFSRIPATDHPRRRGMYGAIILGVPLYLSGSADYRAAYWLIPCLLDLSRRYPDGVSGFHRHTAAWLYGALILQLGRQYWQQRHDYPVPAFLAALLTSAIATYYLEPPNEQHD